MSKSVALFFICVFQFIAFHVDGQSNRISLNLHDVALREAFNTIENNSEYRFFFSDDFINLKHKVSIVIVDASIEDILFKLLAKNQLNYKIAEKNLIIIIPDHGRNNIVIGRVTEKSGQSIIDVNVVLKGTQKVVRTNEKGMFSIEIQGQNSILQFSYLGYETVELPASGRNLINVTLTEKYQSLQQIVVVGFGLQIRSNVTGAIATLNDKSLDTRPVINMGQALQGVIPGLNITQSGGSLENRPTMNIRGVATIGQGSTGGPLILIDGMEADINTLNPDDIDNISVLKDAAASSIYGSRAPFGVILVTTKKGKAGKMQVNFSSSFRSNSPVVLPKLVDSYTFANYFNTGCINAQIAPFFSAERVQRIQDFQVGKLGKNTIVTKPGYSLFWDDGYNGGNDNIDWFQVIYKKTAPSQEHNINVNGGNDKITYYLSANMLNQDGFMKLGGDAFQRYTTTAKIDAKLSKWATLSYNMRYTREDYVRPSALSGGFNENLARQGWPMLPLYDPNGYLYSSPSWALSMRDGGRDRSQNDWTYQQLKLTLEPIKGWKVFADLNYKVNDYFRHWDTQLTYNHNVSGAAVLYGSSSGVHEESARTNYFSPNIYTEYFKSLGDHNLKLLLGYQSELNKNRSLSADRSGIIVPGSPVMDITTGTDYTGKIVSPGVGGQYQEWATSGYFGRLNYDYKGRYLLEANLRYDGTSRFQSAKRWNYFPSVSGGWNIAQEKFWKPIENIANNFKLRASYGYLGNQNTSNLYPTYVTMPFGAANSTWLVGGVKTNTSSAPGSVNTSLKWETVSTYNYGADMGVMKNRLTMSFDYFIRFTNDMIGPAPELPATFGTTVPKTNNTDLKTYGTELTLSWQDRLKNGLSYNVKFMLSDSQTKITNFPNPAGNLSTDNSSFYSGEQYGEIWGYQTIGIAKTQAEMDAHLATLPNGGQDALGSNWRAGDIMYKDVNGDGKIDAGSSTTTNHGDMTVIGNSTPRYSFGLDLSADWKGFDFRTFFQGILQRDYFQGSYYFWGIWSQNNVWESTALMQQMDYFRDDPKDPLGLNLNGYYPRPIFNTAKDQQIQTRYLQNAAYIRFKNVQIGYTIPEKVSRIIRIQKCRIYISGENIWTLTKLSTIFDPETIDGGFGGNVYPLSKVYSVGLSISL